MSTLILLRHGRSTSNTAGTLAGRTPGIHLDENGESQAMKAGERLRGVSLAAAVRSPMERCAQTLDLALASAGLTLPQDVDERFTECDYGAWSNRPLAELTSEALWPTIQSQPSAVTFPGGESMHQMRERMVAGVADWNARLGEHDAWLLVSHGDPIKALVSDALGQPFDNFQRIMVDPASMCVIHYPVKGSPLLVCTNSTSGQLRQLVPTAPAAQLGGGAGTDHSEASAEEGQANDSPSAT